MDRKAEPTTPFNIYFEQKNREREKKTPLASQNGISVFCLPAVIVGIDLLQIPPSLAGRCRELGLHSLPDTHEIHTLLLDVF